VGVQLSPSVRMTRNIGGAANRNTLLRCDLRVPGFESRMFLVARELLFSVTLKDCEVQHFRAGGPGGQHQNKTSSASRVIHHPSGARGESREERSQPQNTKTAFLRMVQTQKFRLWVTRMSWGNPESPEKRVERDMSPENLLIMGRENGKWKVID
jgi:RF-1 domain